jgi:hypothetical protein
VCPSAIGFEQFGIEMAENGDNGPLSVFDTEGPLAMEAFSFIVSSTGFFSRITVPGLVGSDPGFNADFSTLEGGPFHSEAEAAPLPRARAQVPWEPHDKAEGWAGAAAWGSISFTAKSRAMSRTISCSGLSVRSMPSIP